MNVIAFNGGSKARGPVVERGGLLAVLDLGSTKITCIIAEAVAPKHRGEVARSSLRVLGVGHQAARGIKGSCIVDLDEVERAIRLTVDAAERMAQRTITDVYVGVSGGRPHFQCYKGEIELAQGVVTRGEAERAMGASLSQVDAKQRVPLHIAPTGFELDGVVTKQAPTGMHGSTLSAEMGVVMIDPAHLKNLSLAVERAHLNVAGYVLGSYAAGRAVLADDEMELGTLLIDMGGSSTSFALFLDGRLNYAESIPVGGAHITSDIARGLNTTLAHAERLKVLMGNTIAASCDELEMMAVPLLGERGVDTVAQVPRSMLTQIIRPRIDEIFEMLEGRIKASTVSRHAGASVVLTGGASQLAGMRDVAEYWLSRQVRVASPLAISGMPDALTNAGFAVAHGLLAYGLKPDAQYHLPDQMRVTVVDKPSSYARRVGRWIADSF